MPDFSRLSKLLLAPTRQLELIRHYNHKYWDGYFTDEQLNNTDVSLLVYSVQSVENLNLLHVSFGLPEQDVKMWWRVLSGEFIYSTIILPPKQVRLLEHSVHHYEPGIHSVTINLVRYWEPQDRRPINLVEEFRRRAKMAHETLAHSEVLSAYGLHIELLKCQDGETFPYADMAGFKARAGHGEYIGQWGPWEAWPYLAWDGVRLGLGIRDFSNSSGWGTAIVF